MTILDEIITHKHQEVAAAKKTTPLVAFLEHVKNRHDFRGFRRSLDTPGVRLIAEIKRQSPSKGVIAENLDPVALATAYEIGGAAALSVLTDARFFGGCMDDLLAARNATDLPVLRKEFIIDEYQVYESVAYGADAILLIARILDDAQMKRLYGLSMDLGIDVLLEVHNAQDFDRAVKIGAHLIGINNRNLADFHTDLNVSMELVAKANPNLDWTPVALSGIATVDDIQMNLGAGIRRFLVGESLVKSPNPSELIHQMCEVQRPNK
jgi:indole-3-glycerol phosphate synthase